MDSRHHSRFVLTDRSYQNLVKRDIAKLSESYGFTPSEVGRINVIVSELTSNLIKHATNGGEILVKRLHEQSLGIEIICLDKGPGMLDPDRMVQDGVSTFGSAGEGLGAIKRMSRDFDLYSQPGIGTVILSRFFREIAKPASEARALPFELGMVLVPKLGETNCGDGFGFHKRKAHYHLLTLDGLGHGTGASEATQAALEEFAKNHDLNPAAALKTIHNSIKRTRGAVGLLVYLQIPEQQIRYCGIGNISGRILTPEGAKSMVSYNGIVGHNIPNTLHEQSQPWSAGAVLVMNSDGLKTQWDLSKLPGLLRHDPTTIAAVLYKSFSRGTDDAIVVVLKAGL